MNLVYDNIIFSLQSAGGISVVWENLLSELALKGEKFTCIEYENACRNIHRKNMSLPDGWIEHRKLFHKVIQQFVNPGYKCEEPFVFHSSFFRICPSPMAKNVTTVHDFIYERQSQMSIPQRIRTVLNHRAILKSDAIVCISKNTQQDLFRYLPDVKRSKIHVIHNGVSLDYRRLPQSEDFYRDYVAYVGGRQAYKNFKFAVDCIADSGLKLLVCGMPLTEHELRMLDKKLGQDRYMSVVKPTNAELNKIYNSVKALLYPSSYEGFGLPVLEAQKAGCPVIALNSSSIPEIIGDCGLLIDRLDVGLVGNKLKMLDSASVRNEIVEAGLDNAEKYSWKKMADQYRELYNTLL